MADGTVVFLINKLTAFIAEKERLLSGVQADARFIKDELTLSLAFLRDADVQEEEEEEEINQESRAWVKTVREISFDMEDVLDEFNLKLSHHGHGIRACLDQQFNSIKSIKALNQIAKRMKAIRTRVEEQQARRISFTPRAGRRLLDLHLRHLISMQPDLLLDEVNLVGIGESKDRLIQLLLDRTLDREVVVVVGEGGLGKTTLAKQVCHDPKVRNHFKCHVWITLTQYFETADLLKDIVQQLFSVLRRPSPSGIDRMSIPSLRNYINRFLQRKRYLIVLDDVWEYQAWEIFHQAFPDNGQGSRILLTTRDFHVANRSCNQSPHKICRLNSLNPADSWTLFCNKTFHRSCCPQPLEEVSRRILSKCEGLPLAIVAISGVLATIDTARIEEWDMVYRSLGAEMQDNDRLGGMRKILSLGYNSLPSHLKSCLLYFSIFPEGYPIEQMRLIRLWIAEGFVTETQGRSLEEVAESYLNKLIERSLIQVVETCSDGRVKRCRIQGLLREIIISKANDQSFTAIVKEGSMIWPEKARRLSIHNAMDRIQRSHFTSRQCSLLVFWGPHFPLQIHLFSFGFNHLRMLVVLDLGGTPLRKFPKQISGLLLLKYLSLRNTEVKSIPSSISKLQYLETLDLKNSLVTELPASIVKLPKLRHILVYRYETKVDDHLQTKYTIGFNFKLPIRIRGLNCLQKLCFLNPNQNPNLLKELGTLDQLRRLGIVKLREIDGRNLCYSIENLINLRSLSLASITEDEIIDVPHLSAVPQYLQRLHLTGRLQKLPDWISSLQNLKKLALKWSRLTDDPLPYLQNLPNLVHLEFLQAYSGDTLWFGSRFQKLKFLGISKLDGLENINVEEGAMPDLEKLIIQSCEKLRRVPSGIEYLKKLKLVEFINMRIELIMTLYPDRVDGDYVRVVGIPVVNFYTYWNNGSWDVISLETIVRERRFPQPRPEPPTDGGGRVFSAAIGAVAAIVVIAAILFQWLL